MSRAVYIYIYRYTYALEAALVIGIIYTYIIYICLLPNATILICFANFTIVTFIYIYIFVNEE